MKFGAYLIALFAAIFLLVFLSTMNGIVRGVDTERKRWQRDAIERGFGTYKDGKFEWKAAGK